MFKVSAEHAISRLKDLIDSLDGFGLEDLFAYVYGTAVKYDEDADDLTFIPLEGREEDYEATKEVMLAGLDCT